MLVELDILEFVDDFGHLRAALGPQVADLTFLDVAPLAILAILVLLKELVKFPQQVRVDVPEEAVDVLNGELMQIRLCRVDEFVDLCIGASEAPLQKLITTGG